MEINIKKTKQKLIRQSLHHRAWRKVVAIGACIVIAATVSALVLPTIALEKTPRCGLEEHIHTADCYNGNKTVASAQINSSEQDVNQTIAATESGGEGSNYADGTEVHFDSAGDESTTGLVCDTPEHKHCDACYQSSQDVINVDGAPVENSAENGPVAFFYEDEQMRATVIFENLREPLPSDAKLIITPLTADAAPLTYEAASDTIVQMQTNSNSTLDNWQLFNIGLIDNDNPVVLDDDVKATVNVLFNEPLFDPGSLPPVPDVKTFVLHAAEKTAFSRLFDLWHASALDEKDEQVILAVAAQTALLDNTFDGSDTSETSDELLSKLCMSLTSASTTESMIINDLSGVASDSIATVDDDIKTTDEADDEVPDSSENTPKNDNELLQFTPSRVVDEYGGINEGVTSLSYTSTGNLNPFAVTLSQEQAQIRTDVQGTYWQRIYDFNELTDDGTYLIVSAEGNKVLKNNASLNTSGNFVFSGYPDETVVLQPVKGNPGYYTVDGVTDRMKMHWQSGAPYQGDLSGYLYNQALTDRSGNVVPAYMIPYTRYYYNNPDPLISISRTPYTVYLKKNDSDLWEIWGKTTSGSKRYLTAAGYPSQGPHYIGSADVNWYDAENRYLTNYYKTRYYRFYDNGQLVTYLDFIYHVYAHTSDLLILKQVDAALTIPEDPVGSGSSNWEEQEKPSYDPYVAVSTAIQGSYDTHDSQNRDIRIAYASDPSTSQIENLFGNNIPSSGQTDYFAQMPDNGKVLTDKSVTYGRDDYEAFNPDSYLDNVSGATLGRFGVTLSALGQDFITSEAETPSPLDVMFIVDLSASMNRIDPGQNNTRAKITVDALNQALQILMDQNDANRVGIVTFNYLANGLMDLGRYAPDTNGRYLSYNYPNISVTARSTDGASFSTKPVAHEGGTFTQRGIAEAYRLLEQADTTYTYNQGTADEVTVTRKPVIVLISDGEPTFCTSNYTDVLNGPVYGDGTSRYRNSRGVQGYYAILSANYYKRMVGIHYGLPATMYTLGLSIVENDNTLADGSSVSNHYRATILNPKASNIEGLANIRTSYAKDIEWMLKSLLDGTYSSDPVKVNTILTGGFGTNEHVHSYVPVNQINDYQSDYDYADGSYMGENTGPEAISRAFTNIIMDNISSFVTYGFETANTSDIVVRDPIGEGMEIKGAPQLRYNGINYSPSSSEGTTITNPDGLTVTTYTYEGVVSMDPKRENTNPSLDRRRMVDLSTIGVTVTTDTSGLQTVTLALPMAALPVYSPDASLSYYYEALPVRLIYQVGLSEASLETIRSLPMGKSATFYTNRWQADGSASADSTFAPMENNPFYNHDGWQEEVSKSDNVTETTSTSRKTYASESPSGSLPNTDGVTQALGNNGKVTVQIAPFETELTVEKAWQNFEGYALDDPPSSITATLYRVLVDEVGDPIELDNEGNPIRHNIVEDFTLSTNNDWKRTFTEAELNQVSGEMYRYYVEETSIDGVEGELTDSYAISYSYDGVAVNVPNQPILITNRSKFSYELPMTGGVGPGWFIAAGVSLIVIACLLLEHRLRRCQSVKRE